MNPPWTLRQLLKTLPAAAYTCDATGLITFFNSEAARLWGREPKLNDPEDRFCGSFLLLNPAGERITHAECWMALALVHGKTFNGGEIVVQQPNGHCTPVLAHANPIYDADGQLLGAVNVLVEISVRKAAEKALAKALHEEAQLKGVLDAAQVGRDWTSDAGAKTEARIFDLQEFEQQRVTEELREELAQQLFATGIFAKDLAETLAADGQAASAERAHRIEASLQRTLRATERLASSLYPAELNREGLATAFEALARKTTEEFDVRCEVRQAGSARFREGQEIHLYRIVEEAVHLAVTTGGARSILIEIFAEGESLNLSVTQDGGPFDQGRCGELGLLLIRSRARSIGAEMSVHQTETGAEKITCLVTPVTAHASSPGC